MKKYVRFGDIPLEELSAVHNGDEGIIGKEKGVSCYECIMENNHPRVVIPQHPTKSTFATLDALYYEYRNGRIKMYVITGDEIGIGSDGEPLVKNVEILNVLYFATV